MKKFLFASFILSVLSGCATVGDKYNGKISSLSFPEINTENVVYVGENMISQGSVRKTKAMIVGNSETTTWNITGGEGVLWSVSDKYEFYAKGTFRTIDYLGIENHTTMLARNIKTNEFCVWAQGFIECADVPFKINDKSVPSVDNFQRNLIYLGMPEANKVVIGYREFNNDMARASFSNDITYNLEMTDEIVYKGAVIKVIKATPSKIEYKVIRNFK